MQGVKVTRIFCAVPGCGNVHRFDRAICAMHLTRKNRHQDLGAPTTVERLGLMRAYRPTYDSWQKMRQRCANPRLRGFHYWGGKGIKVDPRWLHSFSTFLVDMGPRQPGETIHRLDSAGDYTPDNCIWITKRAHGLIHHPKRAKAA